MILQPYISPHQINRRNRASLKLTALFQLLSPETSEWECAAAKTVNVPVHWLEFSPAQREVPPMGGEDNARENERA
jgi:hypothetical protein